MLAFSNAWKITQSYEHLLSHYEKSTAACWPAFLWNNPRSKERLITVSDAVFQCREPWCFTYSKPFFSQSVLLLRGNIKNRHTDATFRLDKWFFSYWCLLHDKSESKSMDRRKEGAKEEETRLIWPRLSVIITKSLSPFTNSTRITGTIAWTAGQQARTMTSIYIQQNSEENLQICHTIHSRGKGKNTPQTQKFSSPPPPDFSHKKNPLHKHTNWPQWKVPERRRGTPNAPSFSHYSAR